ncbi:hypothetical protein Tco_1088952 [Tanacetum coccineum]
MQEKPNLSKAQGVNTPNEANHMQRFPYASAIGSIMKFIDGLGNVMPTNKRPMEMLCDNIVAIDITSDPGIMKGPTHYQRKYIYIRRVIRDGEIVLKKVYIDDNVADPFTKPMPYTKHFDHAMGIGVHPATSLM